MVEDTITDGKRIGQFLASELTGLEQGPLARVDIVDVDPNAEPSPEGTVAYTVTYDDQAVAESILLPDAVELQRKTGNSWDQATYRDISVDGSTLRIETVAGVKQAVDCLAATIDDAE